LIVSMEQRADRLRQRSRHEDRLSRYFPSGNSTSRSLLNSMTQSLGETRRSARFHRDAAAHHLRMRRKYERAASHPWESVPPDPAPPTIRPEPVAPPEAVEPPGEPKQTGPRLILSNFGPMRNRYSSGLNINYELLTRSCTRALARRRSVNGEPARRACVLWGLSS
jgi:hypothetical protein